MSIERSNGPLTYALEFGLQILLVAAVEEEIGVLGLQKLRRRHCSADAQH